MRKKIGVIFATRNAIQPVLDGFAHHAPGALTELFMDEGLLTAARAEGRVTPAHLRRFASLVARAEESGVDGILFSCTFFSPYRAALEPFFSVPLMGVDEAMLEEAAATDGTVGVIAGVEETEKLSVAQLRAQAEKRGTAITVLSATAVGAFEILPSDPEKHDALVLEAARAMAARVDRIVLAQMSMSRVAPRVASLGKPVLTSMESAVKAIMRAVAAKA